MSGTLLLVYVKTTNLHIEQHVPENVQYLFKMCL